MGGHGGAGLDNARALYVEAIERGEYDRAIEVYAGERYTQHSHPVPDGKQGFVAFFADFVAREPDRRMDVLRGFQDGQYVFLHVVQVLGGEPCWITMDVFDTDERGRLIEHWDIIGAWPTDAAAAAAAVDGPTEPSSLHRTEENKNLVRRYLEDVVIGGDVDVAPSYVTGPAPDGGPLLLDRGRSTRYHATRLLVGCGNLVAALSHAIVAGVDCAVMDLFQVEDGRIVDHWDTVEAIAPVEEWVNSGKF